MYQQSLLLVKLVVFQIILSLKHGQDGLDQRRDLSGWLTYTHRNQVHAASMKFPQVRLRGAKRDVWYTKIFEIRVNWVLFCHRLSSFFNSTTAKKWLKGLDTKLSSFSNSYISCQSSFPPKLLPATSNGDKVLAHSFNARAKQNKKIHFLCSPFTVKYLLMTSSAFTSSMDGLTLQRLTYLSNEALSGTLFNMPQKVMSKLLLQGRVCIMLILYSINRTGQVWPVQQVESENGCQSSFLLKLIITFLSKMVKRMNSSIQFEQILTILNCKFGFVWSEFETQFLEALDMPQPLHQMQSFSLHVSIWLYDVEILSLIA